MPLALKLGLILKKAVEDSRDSKDLGELGVLDLMVILTTTSICYNLCRCTRFVPLALKLGLILKKAVEDSRDSKDLGELGVLDLMVILTTTSICYNLCRCTRFVPLALKLGLILKKAVEDLRERA